MTANIEFFFDFRSPYSYLAASQLPTLGADITLRPVKILTLMDLVGNVPTTLTCKAKASYAQRDLMRWVHKYSVTMNPSNMRDNDGDACSRAVLSASDAPQALRITQALFQALWGQAQGVADSEAVLAVLKGEGIDTQEIAERIDAPETAAILDENTNEAAERGVFGAPTLFVGETMFFGNDRLDFLRDELARLGRAA